MSSTSPRTPFDVVVCAEMLEHDPAYWLSLGRDGPRPEAGRAPAPDDARQRLPRAPLPVRLLALHARCRRADRGAGRLPTRRNDARRAGARHLRPRDTLDDRRRHPDPLSPARAGRATGHARWRWRRDVRPRLRRATTTAIYRNVERRGRHGRGPSAPTHIAVLNDDIAIKPGALRFMADVLDDYPDIGVVYPDVNADWDSPIYRGLERTTGTWGAGGMTGFCFMFRATLGIPFDEAYQWWYGDDAFEEAVRDAGLSVARVTGVPIRHVPGRSAGAARRPRAARRSRPGALGRAEGAGMTYKHVRAPKANVATNHNTGFTRRYPFGLAKEEKGPYRRSPLPRRPCRHRLRHGHDGPRAGHARPR